MVEGLGQRVSHRHLASRLVGARGLERRDGLVREDLEGLDVLEARDEAAARLVDLQDADELVARRERHEEKVVRMPCAGRGAAAPPVDPPGVVHRLLPVEVAHEVGLRDPVALCEPARHLVARNAARRRSRQRVVEPHLRAALEHVLSAAS